MAAKLLLLALVVLLLTDGAVRGEGPAGAAQRDTSRSANPGREKGAFQKLNSLMNRTEDRRTGIDLYKLDEKIRRTKMRKLDDVNPYSRDVHKMLNDNQGVVSKEGNLTSGFVEKVHQIHREGNPLYVMEVAPAMPQVTGTSCDFEGAQEEHCGWQWNLTLSEEGHGFKVMSPADLRVMNESSPKWKYSGPLTDASGDADGHFLYLPVDPTTRNMVVKSPPFMGLWEFCKFEASLHQHGMQYSNIRLVSEASASNVQLILQEVAGNNDDVWRPLRFLVGRVQQEVRILLEVSPVLGRVSPDGRGGPLAHVAVDNVRMVDCLPEPPQHGGLCLDHQIKCPILGRESCVKKQQVCDLVKDCDDGLDENHNCGLMPYGSYCDFEVDSCGFHNVPQPILKWTRHSGPTPTDKTGPSADHTCGPAPAVPPPAPPVPVPPVPPCRGYYLYVNMNTTGPNNQKADFASTAVMNSVIFNPPPRVHQNNTSRYYNCCMIRFYYQQNGKNYGSISVELVEVRSRGNTTTSLWFSTKDKGEHWLRANIFLPNVTSRYFLQFKTRMGMRIYSDSAIDDFSLSPECFGINIDPDELGDYNYYEPELDEHTTPHHDFEDTRVYRFGPCGASGQFGPNQTMCDAAYNNTGYRVDVLDRGHLAGVQQFTVPEDGYYTIIASGSAGGSGGAGGSGAAGRPGWYARGVVELRGGHVLHLLVGQRGGDACRKSASGAERYACGTVSTPSGGGFKSRTHEVRFTDVAGGGGGGGGATYVFMIDGETWTPLVVGGGGGGRGVGDAAEGGGGGGLWSGAAGSPAMYGDPDTTPGVGGGWVTSADSSGFPSRGRGVREGGAGGVGCGARGAHGGYGGGGGGCQRGGGGGGYVGGSAGAAGVSYAVGELPHADLHHRPHGDVTIIPAIKGCGCEFWCVALDAWRAAVKCLCPARQVADPAAPHRCIPETRWDHLSWIVMIALAVIVFFIVAIVLCACLFLYNKYQKKKEAEERRKQLLEQEVQLHRLRNPPGGDSLAAFNPHYGSEGFLTTLGVDVRGLPQVARETLRLVKGLGQGAFGEVYQGKYRHRAGDAEMLVAIKTLPELSTGQAESDFLMEAAIMAKFSHPNIVHLIGVCFDKHPRFIVLELLAGGDLKTFLRDCRPRPERACPISMQDLLQCAVDVAKGCKYLESRRFIHRDIAARNCLLTSRAPGRVVKIADFGMARDVYRSDYYRKGGKAMLPIKWMPPEAYVDGIFSVYTDVWSFGVLLWEVLSMGMMPYTGCSNREVMDLVSGGGRLEKPYNKCPVELYRLMCECWNPVPENRPSFTHIHDRLLLFIQDPEILSAPLAAPRAVTPAAEDKTLTNGPQSMAGCDYLVPLSARDSAALTSSTDTLVPHSGSPPSPDPLPCRAPDQQKASLGYGSSRGGPASNRDGGASATNNNQFLSSNSTDRLISSAEETSAESTGSGETVWETSFSHTPASTASANHGPEPHVEAKVEKLISITPTSPHPPTTALSASPQAPIASPDPPRISPLKLITTTATLEPVRSQRPLCLDAAQLEQNLNALKKNSGCVNLNTMNILPPYINVVTPNKLADKTIQIDPKKAVIYDLQSPEDGQGRGQLRQSGSAASLLDGPMTDVPFADSDNASSSSSGSAPNQIGNITLSKPNDYTDVKIRKQSVNDSEISC